MQVMEVHMYLYNLYQGCQLLSVNLYGHPMYNVHECWLKKFSF